MKKDNNFILPLYHGTSDIWLENIQKFGLGGKNIINDYDLKAMFNEAVECCQRYKILDSIEMLLIERMAASETGLMNWQYGDVYVSVCPNNAENYAISNKYGSEYLSTIMLFDKKIRDQEIDFKYTTELHNDLVNELNRKAPKPILITINNVDITKLTPENSNLNIEKAVERIEKLYMKYKENINDFYVFANQSNFRISVPVYLENIKWEYINVK